MPSRLLAISRTTPEFGWFGFFAKILFFLKLFQQAVVNWGVAIIALTLFVKLLFFPLTQKGFESIRRMQAIQPKLNAMKEKFKDNKECRPRRRWLFKGTTSIRWVAVPMLIQFPVWIALYNVMLYSVELYDTGSSTCRTSQRPTPTASCRPRTRS